MKPIKFNNFFKDLDPVLTKVKFNMNSANLNFLAYDNLLADDEKSFGHWISMNSHRTKQPNNNLDKAKYLLAFAQYYPLGTNYYIFGGLYKVSKKIQKSIMELVMI